MGNTPSPAKGGFLGFGGDHAANRDRPKYESVEGTRNKRCQGLKKENRRRGRETSLLVAEKTALARRLIAFRSLPMESSSQEKAMHNCKQAEGEGEGSRKCGHGSKSSKSWISIATRKLRGRWSTRRYDKRGGEERLNGKKEKLFRGCRFKSNSGWDIPS